jgi:hypothetical protein
MPEPRSRSRSHVVALSGGLLWTVAIAAILAAVGLAGCGGDDDEPATFESGAFPFTFQYPGGFEVTDDVSVARQLGGAADETVGIATDDDNALILQRFTLNRAVDKGNLDVAKRELDGLVKQFDPRAALAKTGELAGFPSLTYEAVRLTTPEDGESRLIVLFQGDQEYLINCQSTPDGRDEVEEACDLAVKTLAPRRRARRITA